MKEGLIVLLLFAAGCADHPDGMAVDPRDPDEDTAWVLPEWAHDQLVEVPPDEIPEVLIRGLDARRPPRGPRPGPTGEGAVRTATAEWYADQRTGGMADEGAAWVLPEWAQDQLVEVDPTASEAAELWSGGSGFDEARPGEAGHGQEAQRLCGIEGVYVMEMEWPWYTKVNIVQDSVAGDVLFGAEAFQQTTIHGTPGSGRQEARHTVEVSGTMAGRSLRARRPWPTCRPDARVRAAWRLRGSIITGRSRVCMEASTEHYATHDYVLHGWSPMPTYDHMCVWVCPPHDLDCNDRVY